jgi:hypothetical protein
LVFLLDERAPVLLLPRDYLFDARFEARQQAFRQRLQDSGLPVSRIAELPYCRSSKFPTRRRWMGA